MRFRSEFSLEKSPLRKPDLLKSRISESSCPFFLGDNSTLQLCQSESSGRESPKMVNSQKWLGEGAKASLSSGRNVS